MPEPKKEEKSRFIADADEVDAWSIIRKEDREDLTPPEPEPTQDRP